MSVGVLGRLLAPMAVLGMSSCATSGAASSGAACTSDLAPAPASLDEAVDSAALFRDLTSTWRGAAGLTVATLRYDSIGGLGPIRVISEFLPEDAEDELGQTIARHAIATGSPSTVVELFVGDEAGPRPRRVRELRTCAPQLLNRDFLAGAMVSAGRTLPLGTRTTVRLYALVREDGTVADVRIDEPSRSRTVDEAAVGVVYLARFVPGRVEGIPTTIWVNFPVTLQRPEPRSDTDAFDRPRPGF